MIAVYDAKRGDLLNTITVPSPAGIAARNDGMLLAVSGNSVVTVDNDTVTPLITDHLDSPSAMTASKDGEIFVTNGGALQDVSVFPRKANTCAVSAKSAVARRWANTTPSGMFNPGSVALDSRGRLWVVEINMVPKRIGVWDVKTGASLKDYWGNANYCSIIWMDPLHPDKVYCDGVEWSVDLEKGTWGCNAIPWFPTKANQPGPAIGSIVFTANNGKQYAFCNGYLYMRDGDVFKPILAFIWNQHPGTGFFTDTKKYPVRPDGNGDTYVWVNKRKDQTLHDDEMTLIGPPWCRAFFWVEKDLSIWHTGGYKPVTKPDGSQGYETLNTPTCIYHPVRIEPDGYPVYDFANPDCCPSPARRIPTRMILIPSTSIPPARTWDRPSVSDAGRATAKAALGLSRHALVESTHQTPAGAGQTLGANRQPVCGGRLHRHVQLLRDLPRLHARRPVRSHAHARPARQARPGTGRQRLETWNGQLINPPGTNKYYLLHGDQDGRISEILGLDTVKRLPGGTYEITEDDAKKAADAMTQYLAQKARVQK